MIQYLLFAFLIGVISSISFRLLWFRPKSGAVRAMLAVAALLLPVPSILFLSYYLLHKPDGIWYIDFRSIAGVEALSGLVGGPLGVAFAGLRLRMRFLNGFLLALATMAAILLVIAPFAKQLMSPLDYSGLKSRWKDGVCRQSSLSTCVPASCATVIRMLGGNLTESQIARASGTTTRGTEIWYAKRALRWQGYDLQAHIARSAEDIPAPAIVGVTVGVSGHVVVLMSKDADGPEVGDPLGIRRRHTWQGFEERYRPSLTYFQIKRVRSGS